MLAAQVRFQLSLYCLQSDTFASTPPDPSPPLLHFANPTLIFIGTSRASGGSRAGGLALYVQLQQLEDRAYRGGVIKHGN
jgi:hypothetical protein